MIENIRIVLVNPLYGGNIGSVCRAMMNMGLRDLAIAEASAAWDMDELRQMAVGAVSIFETRGTFDSLREAVADCGLVAATSGRRGLYRSHARTPREWAPHLLEAAATKPVALVFGTEDSGLTNEHLALCTQVVQIPSSPDYPSLNLSQAVMVCAYELFVASQVFEASEEPSPEATAEIRQRMFDIWRETLLGIGFAKEDKIDHMMMGLRRILSRGTLTENDVKILMGIARQSQWCAGELAKERPEWRGHTEGYLPDT